MAWRRPKCKARKSEKDRWGDSEYKLQFSGETELELMVAVRVGHRRHREKAEAERQERRPLRKRQEYGVAERQEADQRKPGSQAGPRWRELGLQGEREFNLAGEREQHFSLLVPTDHSVL